MNNKQIAEILLRDMYARRTFKGVYPRNRLPYHINTRRPSAFIINTDVASGPGEHWVVVWLDGKGHAEYLDSFGLAPWRREIKQFIERHSWSYRYNQRLLQDFRSSACGLYCIHFVRMKSRGASLARTLAPFSSFTPRANDRTVFRLLQPLLCRTNEM